MYKALKLLIVFLLTYFSVFAQNKSSIKGTIVDSLDKSALEYATVAVVSAKDSSLISYTLSVKDGTFALHNLPVGKPLKLVISFVGYTSFRKAQINGVPRHMLIDKFGRIKNDNAKDPSDIGLEKEILALLE